MPDGYEETENIYHLLFRKLSLSVMGICVNLSERCVNKIKETGELIAIRELNLLHQKHSEEFGKLFNILSESITTILNSYSKYESEEFKMEETTGEYLKKAINSLFYKKVKEQLPELYDNVFQKSNKEGR